MLTTVAIIAVMLVIAIVIVLILAATKPESFRIERSATINAPPERIFAVLSDLWRKKMRIREEGYRRPQDALLSVQGVRIFEEEKDEKAAAARAGAEGFTVACSDVGKERGKVESLFQALMEAKKRAGEDVKKSGNLESFEKFVKNKTAEIRKQYGCESVEYSVEMQGGKVKLTAKAKT